MNAATLNQFIAERVVPGVTANLEEHGYLAPVSFVLYSGGRWGIAAPESFDSDIERYIYARLVEELAQSTGAEAVVTCLQGGLLSLSKEELARWQGDSQQIKDDPRTVSVVIIFGTTAEGQYSAYHLHFSDSDGVVIVGELKTMVGPQTEEIDLGDFLPNPWHIAFSKAGQ